MRQEAIHALDQAALHLIQALEVHGEELKPYIEADKLQCVDCLKDDVLNLRRVLLGLQIGVLYDSAGEVPPDILEEVVHDRALSIEEGAARVSELLHEQQRIGA